MTIAEHLKRNGITLTAFAASIGEKVPTVHGWMSGRRNPGLASLVAIERVTNGAVRPADFLPPTPPPADPEPHLAAANDATPKRSRTPVTPPPTKPKRTRSAAASTPPVEQADAA